MERDVKIECKYAALLFKISRGDKSLTMPLIGWDRVMAPREMEAFARTLEEYLPHLVEHLYGLSPKHHEVILTHD